MSRIPEALDFAQMSNDPSDELDECIHVGEEGPHNHRGPTGCPKKPHPVLT